VLRVVLRGARHSLRFGAGRGPVDLIIPQFFSYDKMKSFFT
jgi:hypothetical protein